MVAAAECHVLANVWAVDVKLVGIGELLRVPIARAGQQHHGGACRDLGAANGGRGACHAEVALDRAFDAQRLLDESGYLAPVLTKPRLNLGILSDRSHREAEQLGGRFLPGGEQERGEPDDVDDLGSGAVGILRLGQVGQHVGLLLAPAFGDVGGELVFEVLQWIMHARHRIVLVIFRRNPEQVGDHQPGKGPCVLVEELTRAAGHEFVELRVGEPPHEVFVFLEPLGGQQAAEQPASTGVIRRVLRHDVFAHRDLRTMLLDQRADVVTLGFERQAGEGPRDRNTRRERRVLVYREGFLVSCYRDDALMGRRQHRPALTQVVEIGVRIGNQGRVGEEIDRFEITQRSSP